MLDIKSASFREKFRVEAYAPRDAERLVGTSPDTQRQRRNAEPPYYGAFGEATETGRWTYSAVDLVGLWLTERFLTEGRSLRQASAMAYDSANVVTAAIADPTAAASVLAFGLVPLKRRDPADALRYNVFQITSTENLADLLRHYRPGGTIDETETIVLWPIRLIESAPPRLISEIRTVAAEADK